MHGLAVDKNQDDLNQFNRKSLPDLMNAALCGTNPWQVRQRIRALGIRRPASPPHAPPVPRPPRVR